MSEKSQIANELSQLRKKVSELEQHKILLKKTKVELQAANQQLDAGNQQLQASEQELIEKEAQAREAREYAENIISTVREPLVILDDDLRVVSASQFFYTTFEVTPKETVGKLLYELGNKQWNIPMLKNLLSKILPEKSLVENYEIEHQFEKIGYKIMLLNARELLQEKDKKRRILLSIQDITQRRQAEQNLKHLNSELKARTKELQEILYITTHDLRSPLVNIQGFNKELGTSLNELAELLESPDIPESVTTRLSPILKEEIPEAMHFITSSTNKMDALLTGLLALSRLGRQKSVFKDIDMNQLIKDVIDNFGYEINKNNIVVNVSDLPPAMETSFNSISYFPICLIMP
ncbi:sensor histidine kinase [Draconibacterium halophilum]|uniref:histidine kinase n=1 Tax=Draconibacterium halophilum TaxID=2706887 RepID=A0A6C0RD96_9BACT|nr:PAS domain-containing protein [Draconibacterium halophilum]QIA07111.1 PAS domain S-box protein [Draconibacterium halophilum]